MTCWGDSLQPEGARAGRDQEALLFHHL